MKCECGEEMDFIGTEWICSKCVGGKMNKIREIIGSCNCDSCNFRQYDGTDCSVRRINFLMEEIKEYFLRKLKPVYLHLEMCQECPVDVKKAWNDFIKELKS